MRPVNGIKEVKSMEPVTSMEKVRSMKAVKNLQEVTNIEEVPESVAANFIKKVTAALTACHGPWINLQSPTPRLHVTSAIFATWRTLDECLVNKGLNVRQRRTFTDSSDKKMSVSDELRWIFSWNDRNSGIFFKNQNVIQFHRRVLFVWRVRQCPPLTVCPPKFLDDPKRSCNSGLLLQHTSRSFYHHHPVLHYMQICSEIQSICQSVYFLLFNWKLSFYQSICKSDYFFCLAES